MKKKLTRILALILAGALVLPGRLHMGAQSPPDTLAPGSSIVEVDSIRELSDAVGFEVCGLDGLPFPVEEQTYTVYWQKLAEILYSSGTQSAVFRKSAGTADNSGDYRVFEDTDTLALDEAAVTLKGNGGGYTLASWTDGTFSYSLSLTEGLSGAEWQAMLAENGWS